MFFNDAITSTKFPSSLRMINIKGVAKKGTKSLNENYRPISILPLVSKIFERITCKQLTIFLVILYQNISVEHNTDYC